MYSVETDILYPVFCCCCCCGGGGILNDSSDCQLVGLPRKSLTPTSTSSQPPPLLPPLSLLLSPPLWATIPYFSLFISLSLCRSLLEHGSPDCHSFLSQIMISPASASLTLPSCLLSSPISSSSSSFSSATSTTTTIFRHGR